MGGQRIFLLLNERVTQYEENMIVIYLGCIFYYSISTIDRRMNEAIKSKKHTDFEQIQHHFKSYKQHYHNRPLQANNIDTYLQLSKFVSKLGPTFISHYGGFIEQNQSNFLIREMIGLYDDVFNKLKYAVEKLERKEKQQSSKKKYSDMCSVCLKALRKAELEDTKQELEANQMSKNIKKIIKDIQDEQPFSNQEDRNFFRELKIALDKKQQVLEMCATESQQFTRYVQDQLSQLMNAREIFVAEKQPRNSSLGKKGTELQDDVGKSIKEHMNNKIPNIIKIVIDNFKKGQQSKRMSKLVHMDVQTVQIQNNKITDLRRKVLVAQSMASAIKAEKQKLEWTVKQKQLLVDKFEKELGEVREQLNTKSFQMQKQIKALDQKCKKYKEQIQRHKSKRQISRKQVESKQFSQTALKTVKNHHKLKQVTLMEEDNIRRRQSIEEQYEERRSRKKKTLHTIKSGSSKYFLPTLTKIHRLESQLVSRTEISVDDDEKEQINVMNKTGMTQGRRQDVVIEKDENHPILSKTTSLQKKGKKGYSLAPKNSQSRSKASNNNSKTGNNSRERATFNGSGKGKQFPLITPRSMKKGIKIKEVPEQQSEADTQKIADQVVMRTSVRKVSNALKEQNKGVRLSQTSLNSAVSILQNVTNDASQAKELHKESTLKNQKDKSSQYKKIKRTQTNPDVQIHQQEKITENGSFVTNLTSRQRYQRNEHNKGCLKNSYSLIRQDIDKQNSMTPVIGIESPGFKGKQITFRQSSNIEKNIKNMMRRISRKSKEVLNMDQKQFNQLFVECLKIMSATKSNDHSENYEPQNFKDQQKIQADSNESPQDSRKKHKVLNQLIDVLSKQQDHSRTKEINSIRQQRSSLDPKPVNLNESFGKSTAIQPIANMQINSKRFEHRGKNYIKSRYSTEYEALKKSIEKKQFAGTVTPSKKKDCLKKSKYNHLQTESPQRYHNGVITNEQMLDKGQIYQHKNKGLILKKIQFDSESIVEAMKLDYILFIDQEKSYEYQCNYSKRGNKHLKPLNSELQTYIRGLYYILDDLRKMNNEGYQQLCSYIRYPFTNSQQGCIHIDIIQNISMNSLVNSFQKIIPLHKKCKTEIGLCSHLILFRKKIMDFMYHQE